MGGVAFMVRGSALVSDFILFASLDGRGYMHVASCTSHLQSACKHMRTKEVD